MDRKVALVSGASSGIGMGIALALAKDGYDLAISYRNNPDGAAEAKRRIESLGAACRTYLARMEDDHEPARLVDQARADFGRLDAMVCNAAKDRRFSILNATAEDLRFMTAQLFSGQMLCAGAAARHMVKDGIHGSILFISSVHGQMTAASDFCYGGMKAAVERACKSLALELSPYRIRVNCIAPGAINVRHRDDSQLKYHYADMVPLGRWGVEEDIAKAARFLLSDEADYITGVTLRVDGGFALPSTPEGWAEPHPIDTGFIQKSYEEMIGREDESNV